eukprot:2640918-Rhodomonas_salina.1
MDALNSSLFDSDDSGACELDKEGGWKFDVKQASALRKTSASEMLCRKHGAHEHAHALKPSPTSAIQSCVGWPQLLMIGRYKSCVVQTTKEVLAVERFVGVLLRNAQWHWSKRICRRTARAAAWTGSNG